MSVKMGDFDKCELLLIHDKYLVYDFDYVIACSSFFSFSFFRLPPSPKGLRSKSSSWQTLYLAVQPIHDYMSIMCWQFDQTLTSDLYDGIALGVQKRVLLNSAAIDQLQSWYKCVGSGNIAAQPSFSQKKNLVLTQQGKINVICSFWTGGGETQIHFNFCACLHKFLEYIFLFQLLSTLPRSPSHYISQEELRSGSQSTKSR